MMDFEKYYRALARKNGRRTPTADEARRDYQAAMRNAVEVMYYTR